MSAPNLNLFLLFHSMCILVLSDLCRLTTANFLLSYLLSTLLSRIHSSLFSTDENTLILFSLPSDYTIRTSIRRNFLSFITFLYFEFILQHLVYFSLSRVIIISGVDRLRSPCLHRYGRNGRRREWKIAGLRRAIKYGLERPTLLEKTAEVRVGRGSMRPGREKIEK